MTPAEQVRSFYAALDAGDTTAAAARLAEDATDDRPDGLVTGAAAIAASRLDDQTTPDSSWSVDAVMDAGHRVAVECTVSWRDPDTGDREAERTSEWLTLRDGLIVEIRSYRAADEDDDDGPPLTEGDFDWSLLETDDKL